MPRYINVDDLPVTTVAIRPYAISEEPYNAEVVFARFVRNAPTADVREVVHGAWQQMGGFICFCTECGGETIQDKRPFDFCPYCGADMRGAE